ncbi:MAG: hypothetical protein JO222_09315 [Frankiales bacterium]|nr:hypothetical protein [Frankiales bacterium]
MGVADDADLGAAAKIPLAAYDDAATPVLATQVQVFVRLPDSSTAGPLSITDDDLVRGWYGYVSAQSGQHRYRVVEATTERLVDEGGFYVWPAYADHTAPWAPSLAEAAGLVASRTFDTVTNTQQNTFTPATDPTDTQVNGYISRIVGEITATAGDIPSRAFGLAKHTATLGVAWLVERQFPPTAAVQNLANDFVNDYRQSLKNLVAASRGHAAGARAQSVSLSSFTYPTTRRG